MGELRVAAAAVPLLREGARFVIRMTADHLGSGDVEADLERRKKLEEMWGLLDLLGWRGEATHSVEIPPSHHDALRATVEMLLPAVEQWFAELPADHPTRAQRGDERRLLMQLSARLEDRSA